MKNIQITAIAIVFTLFATMAFGQIKVVAPNGDVGIGTSTPNEKLEVNGGVLVGNTTNTNAGTIRYNGSDLQGYVGGAWTSLTDTGGGGGGGSVWSQSGSTTYLTSGLVGIGTSTPVSRLHVWSGDNKGIMVQRVGFPADNWLRIAHGGTNGFVNSNAGRFDFRVGNINVISATPGLDVGIGTTAPTEKLHVNGNVFTSGLYLPSDKNLKNNVNEFNYGLSEVLKMNPISYNYNGEGGIDSKEKHVGVMAQDLKEIAPKLVTTFDYIVHDEENRELQKETYLKINDTAIKYMLINSIKEQQELIEEKDVKIAELADRLEDLEEIVNSIANNAVKDVELSNTPGVLLQNQPNPFGEETTINYVLPKGAKNSVIYIRDMNGNNLEVIVLDSNQTGSANLNAKALSAGTYTYSLVVDGKIIDTKRMILTK